MAITWDGSGLPFVRLLQQFCGLSLPEHDRLGRSGPKTISSGYRLSENYRNGCRQLFLGLSRSESSIIQDVKYHHQSQFRLIFLVF
jgi:hypothetical protein